MALKKVTCDKCHGEYAQEFATEFCPHCFEKAINDSEIKQLRAELEAAKAKLAEYEARKCENCNLKHRCRGTISMSFSELGDTVFMLTGCSSFEPKEKQP